MESIISGSVYIRVLNAVMLGRYDENNISELITAIFFILRAEESHRDILVRFVKTKVNHRILPKIENLNNIYDILIKLIQILDTYNTNIRTRISINEKEKKNKNK